MKRTREENASSSSSSAAMQETANAAAILGAQGSEQIQETADHPLLRDLFGTEAVGETANAEVLALKKELEKLRAVALAPKRAPGRPKKPANAEAEGEPAPKRAKPGRPVGSKSLTPTQGRDAEAHADTLPAKRKPGRPKTVKREVEEEVWTPGEASSGRQPRAKERGPGRPRRGAGVAEAAAADGTQKRLSDFFDMSPQGKVDASASSLFARPFDGAAPAVRWPAGLLALACACLCLLVCACLSVLAWACLRLLVCLLACLLACACLLVLACLRLLACLLVC